jgi:peptidoglycan L-alanyl-D-glutamate endopeptidase CwlK
VGKAPYNPNEKFEIEKQIADAMLAAAKELGTPIVWGGNWIKTKDFPHFELAK